MYKGQINVIVLGDLSDNDDIGGRLLSVASSTGRTVVSLVVQFKLLRYTSQTVYSSTPPVLLAGF